MMRFLEENADAKAIYIYPTKVTRSIKRAKSTDGLPVCIQGFGTGSARSTRAATLDMRRSSAHKSGYLRRGYTIGEQGRQGQILAAKMFLSLTYLLSEIRETASIIFTNFVSFIHFILSGCSVTSVLGYATRVHTSPRGELETVNRMLLWYKRNGLTIV